LKNISLQIFETTSQLPKNWDDVAHDNAFLKQSYLNVLEIAAPVNMQCFYIGIFENRELIGVVLAQYLDLNKLTSFGDRDKCIKTMVRNFVFRNFAGHVLFLGNNMITGQNSYAFIKELGFDQISKILIESSKELINYFKKRTIKIHIVAFKDFYPEESQELKKYELGKMYEFNTQPNMIFKLNPSWKSKHVYIAAMSKKYRDQYKRAHKKSEGILVKELTLNEIVNFENRLYALYEYVAHNAPFNTFFLAKNHFSSFKKQCKDRFKVFGYYEGELLVGFHTLLLNGNTLETYFLGYDEKVQKEKMLYLNMLYNMTEYGIENNFGRIIFGRTALEIKSSIGAEPLLMSGFLFHTNKWINTFIPKIFPKLEPESTWQQRHPFK
jgi:hypothetical protein